MEKFFSSCSEFKTHKNIVLTINYRQHSNIEHLHYLNKLRRGECDDDSMYAYFKKRISVADLHIDPTYTRLIYTNKERNNHNAKMLANIKIKLYTYESAVKYYNDYIPNEWPFQMPQSVSLKLGAPVLCLRNIQEHDLANGTQGVIIAIDNNELTLLTRDNKTITQQIETLFDNKRNIIGECKGMPFTLAYAMTIHKVQGLTLDKIVIHINNMQFTWHLFYVALSRAQNIKYVYIITQYPFFKHFLKTITI
ncbi:ATP-dependent DNA helicase pif1-like [Hydra vulgaris]|uniref:ATP-dependent DNA helicase pif1-like n=1 Tax=Hydra vulgaris TaxID=6087 RepID=A0ABM4CU02_HYDVU